ncbi:hypothetical protein QYM36_012368 [Artemia franciscana]|uniref:Uncharacterized protein n=1 Tax=Artemia franciscana TaxID=6661 RepID=A0AA88KXG7_ARTSF|nr:hypothetical protein QYM36_012368 [Artemia franciscana]
MLAIQPYDIKLRYKPGKTIPVADTLSRLHLADTDIESQVDVEILVHSVLQTVPIASQRLAQIRRETTKDETLNSLLETIQVGWPNNKKSLDRKLGPFWNYRHELAELDGLVVKGERIVIQMHESRHIRPITLFPSWNGERLYSGQASLEI